jgi:hypothetical protein
MARDGSPNGTRNLVTGSNGKCFLLKISSFCLPGVGQGGRNFNFPYKVLSPLYYVYSIFSIFQKEEK